LLDARAFFEAQRWPHGVTCPFCNKRETVSPLRGESMGPGWYFCNSCNRQKFTVRTGSVMERSHIPLAKWALGFRLMAASKKGMSAKQIERMLGITYRAAWFMCHRIREAMRDDKADPIGGEGKIIEAHETFVGGKAKNVHKGKPIPKKAPVVALVERSGKLRARHVVDVTAKSLRKVLDTRANKKSELHTDEAAVYLWLGREFAKHRTVNHSAKEYVSKDGQVYVNTAESFFAIFKRGIYGTFHALSEKHLHRYTTEFEFRWNHRAALEIDDEARTSAAIKGAAGKRLTYRPSDSAQDA